MRDPLTRCWMSAYGHAAPIEKFCQVFGWPHFTTDGEKMYENTHFMNLDDAWARHLREHEAGLELEASRVTNLRAQLATAEAACANAAIFLAAAKQAHRKYAETPRAEVHHG